MLLWSSIITVFYLNEVDINPQALMIYREERGKASVLEIPGYSSKWWVTCLSSLPVLKWVCR